MLFFNGARDYFQVLRYRAMDYFQWCQLYGTNNYFSIFFRILYGTKDYFPDFSTGPMIFLPFLKKFSRFLEPYCQSLKWVWRHISSQSYDIFTYREIQICRPASGLARESKRHGRLSFDHGCQGHDFISIWICLITYFSVTLIYAIASQHVRVSTGAFFPVFIYTRRWKCVFPLTKRQRNLAGSYA